MVKGGVGKIVKCLLFIVTFLICLSGIAVFSIGVWASMQKVYAVEQLIGSEMYTYAAYFFIASGATIAFVSSLGCCGAMKEDRFKLGLYFLVLLVVFVILLAGGILGFMFKSKVQEKLYEEMGKSVKLYGEKEYVTNAWDALQKYFKCCGFSNDTTDSYHVWEGNEYLKKQNLTVPLACCKDLENIGPCQKDPKSQVHQEDCYVVVKDYIKKNAIILGGIGLGIAFFLIIGMVLTYCLFRTV